MKNIPHSKGDFLANYLSGNFRDLPRIERRFQTQQDADEDEICGWFLGTRGENEDVLLKFIEEAIHNIVYGKSSFHPEDPNYITEHKKHSEGYLSAIESLRDNFNRMVTTLNDHSVPWFSMRYQGHMNWDVTLPSMIGYFTAMLQNQNNVSIQGSTATTYFEMMVGKDLCNMIGFPSETNPWSHITCGGTVANIESAWAARELKYLPLSIKEALNNDPTFKAADAAKHITVKQPNGDTKVLTSLSTWELLNITCGESLKIPECIAKFVGISEADVWKTLFKTYTINAVGFMEYTRRYLDGISTPVIIVPSSKHYSWPKAAALLGMGKENGLINIFVTPNARMDIDALKTKLNDCAQNKVPVIMTVGVVGSTEESAIDPLEDILALREQYRKQNFDFQVHADAAWGGYGITAIRKDFNIKWPVLDDGDSDSEKNSTAEEELFVEDTSSVPFSEYSIAQMKRLRDCDSVTIDPHKWGYTPYPAGSLSYLNGKIINLLTFGAPYIGTGSDMIYTIGQSGIEGSKPGAAAASVFLSHSVIRPSVKGHGKIIKRTLINTKLFYLYLLEMNQKNDPFFVVPLSVLPPLPSAITGVSSPEELLSSMIYGKTYEELTDPKHDANPHIVNYLKELGPDQNIVDYMFNFYNDDGTPNTDINKANKLNRKIFTRLYPQPDERVYKYDLMVSFTEFYRKDYGANFMDTLAKRLKVKITPDDYIGCLRSTIMNPWVADIQSSNAKEKPFNFFRLVIIPALRQTVLDCIKEVKESK